MECFNCTVWSENWVPTMSTREVSLKESSYLHYRSLENMANPGLGKSSEGKP